LKQENSAMATIPIPSHIVLDDRGVARIQGTRSKVQQVVMDWRNGMSPEKIQTAYPHLSLGQIYAALSYYHDHAAEIDAQIQADEEYVERMRALTPPVVTRAELEARMRARSERDRS
jgi:uncharacterized protein (DUF433 family)